MRRDHFATVIAINKKSAAGAVALCGKTTEPPSRNSDQWPSGQDLRRMVPSSSLPANADADTRSRFITADSRTK